MKITKKLKVTPVALLLTVIATVYILPLLIIFTNSFMSQGEMQRNYNAAYTAFDYHLNDKIHYAEYRLIPESISFEQYNSLLFKTPVYLELFMNSVKITIPSVLAQIIVGSLAAYGFTACRFRFKEALFCVYIIVMVLPYQATLVPNYIVISRLGLLNTHLSVILPAVFSPFAIFVMRQSMKAIHEDILNAAQLDGAAHLHRFIYIAAPLTKGGIASLFILSFIDSWGMVEQPLVFIYDTAKEPLSIFLSSIGSDSSGLIFAASFFYMIPAVWLFIYGQEYFKQGVMLSAIK